MIIKERDRLYFAARNADEAFDEAISRQFGEHMNRYYVAAKDYNEDTRAAYDRKIKADEAWLTFVRLNGRGNVIRKDSSCDDPDLEIRMEQERQENQNSNPRMTP